MRPLTWTIVVCSLSFSCAGCGSNSSESAKASGGAGGSAQGGSSSGGSSSGGSSSGGSSSGGTASGGTGGGQGGSSSGGAAGEGGAGQGGSASGGAAGNGAGGAGLGGSSSGGAAGAGGAGGGDLYSDYCAGTLLTEQTLMAPIGNASWKAVAETAPVGTKFLVSAFGSDWDGYVIKADGSPRKIEIAFGEDFIRDKDFTSACATDDKLLNSFSAIDVLLAKSTFYASPDLSGTPCSLPAGTELTSFSFVNGVVASVSCAEIKATCGFDSAYSKDITYGELFAK